MVEILNENDNTPVFAEDTVQSLIMSEVWHFHKHMYTNLCKTRKIKALKCFSACRPTCVFSSWLQWILWSSLSGPQTQITTRSFTPLTRHQWVLLFYTPKKGKTHNHCIIVDVSVCVLQPDAEYFKVELPNSGEVILSKPLDYETKTLLTVTIHASVSCIYVSFLTELSF